MEYYIVMLSLIISFSMLNDHGWFFATLALPGPSHHYNAI
jgi:hypothetical protein